MASLDVFAALLSFGCGSAESSAPQPGRGNPCAALDFAAFDATVSTFLDDSQLDGASVAVVDESCGIVHQRGYGEHAPDRLYLVGSASKILSAGILLGLQDEGVLDIDVALGQYLSAWSDGGKSDLTVAQLLSNSSGLVGLVDRPFYAPYRCQYQTAGTLGECARTIYEADDATDRISPDTAFRYGGGQWQLAGGLAEIVSGEGWAELVRRFYVEPCDAPSIGYTNAFEAAAAAGGIGSALDYPTFFGADRAKLPVVDNPNVEGGLFTTAADYGKILLMHLRGGECASGRVLSRQAVERMQMDRILAEYGGSTAGQRGRAAGGDAVALEVALEGYGLGWWIDRREPGVFADPGLYGAFPWLDRSRGYGALLLLEADGDRGAALWLAVKPSLDALFDARAAKDMAR